MQTIKIIDLLNQIVNEEKIPKEIKYDYHVYLYDESFHNYYQVMSGGNQLRFSIQEFEEFVRLFTKYNYLFNQVAIFDTKTYSTNSKDKKEKCYKQEVMYGKGVEYLTSILPKHHYEIWLPHNKSGRIIDLDAFIEGKKVEYK